MPRLAHWFGLRPVDLWDMSPADLGPYIADLEHLPPPGRVVLVNPSR